MTTCWCVVPEIHIKFEFILQQLINANWIPSTEMVLFVTASYRNSSLLSPEEENIHKFDYMSKSVYCFTQYGRAFSPCTFTAGVIEIALYRAFRTGKITGLTQHLVPPIRPDYFRFCTQNFESGLTPLLIYLKHCTIFCFAHDLLKVG